MREIIEKSIKAMSQEAKEILEAKIGIENTEQLEAWYAGRDTASTVAEAYPTWQRTLFAGYKEIIPNYILMKKSYETGLDFLKKRGGMVDITVPGCAWEAPREMREKISDEAIEYLERYVARVNEIISEKRQQYKDAKQKNPATLHFIGTIWPG